MPDQNYFTDDYARTGCVAAIDVTEHGYSLSVFDPSGRRIETYAYVKSPRAIARMLEEWCNGRRPRLKDRLDQPASGSAVTVNT